jgi:hypothetical protein
LKRQILVDRESPYAINIEGAFEFDSAKPPDQGGGKRMGMRDRAGAKDAKKKAKKDKAEAKDRKKKGLPEKVVEEKKEDDGVPFSLRGIDFKIHRGEFRSRRRVKDG